MQIPKLTTLYGMEVPNLEAGQTARIVCPQCRGGSTNERSMIVSRDHFAVSWYCFRANCGEKGRQITPGGVVDDPLEPTEKPLRPYTGTMTVLNSDLKKSFLHVYDLRAPDILYSPDDERYLLPIRKYNGDIRGYTARAPWGRRDIVPKSLTYFNEHGPLLAWYHPGPKLCDHKHDMTDTLVVEDQLSAMRAAQHLGITTCAILGTGLNEEKVQELQQHTDRLIIALDADATGQAFAMARKWGQAFNNCKVLVLKQDIKDMPLKDLTNLNI